MKASLRICVQSALLVSAVTATQDIAIPVTTAPAALDARQFGIQPCGYRDGDPNRPRNPAQGWYCATDTSLNYWGFCPTTISDVEKCPIARVCVDTASCATGCGRLGYTSTYSCKSTDFCNEDLLVDGSQTYRYFSCGGSPKSQPPLLASAITNYGASSTPAAQEASNVTPVAEPPTTPTSAASSRDEAGSAVQVSSTATAARSSVAVQSSSAAEPGQDIKLAGVLGSVVLAVLAYL